MKGESRKGGGREEGTERGGTARPAPPSSTSSTGARRAPQEKPAKPLLAEPLAEEAGQAGGRPERRRAIIFLVITFLLVITLTFGYLSYQRWERERVTTENRYNGFDFYELHTGKLRTWETIISLNGSLYALEFYYHPREVEDVVLQPMITRRFLDPRERPARLYLSLSPDAGSTPVVAGVEISKVTGRQLPYLGVETRGALHAPPPTNESEVVVVTCDDATSEQAVIFFEEGAANLIVEDSKNPWCIRLQYRDANESVRVADRLAYALLGIMPD